MISGAPSGTYIFFAPIVSLRAMDEGVPNTPVYAQGLAEARAKARPPRRPRISDASTCSRVEPRLSYVSDAFAEVDREFCAANTQVEPGAERSPFSGASPRQYVPIRAVDLVPIRALSDMPCCLQLGSSRSRVPVPGNEPALFAGRAGLFLGFEHFADSSPSTPRE